jgi:hypothetical protein
VYPGKEKKRETKGVSSPRMSKDVEHDSKRNKKQECGLASLDERPDS